MELRPMAMNDYEAVAAFWQDHFIFKALDDRAHIEVFLNKNPDISTIALDDEGRIIGTCMGSYDGRKGYFQKVVVHPDYRGKGLGKKLVLQTMDNMRQAGAVEFRVDCDESNAAFYQSCGFVPYAISSFRIKEH